MVQNLYSMIYRTSAAPKVPKEIDEDIAMIINKCFTMDPLRRIDIIELIEKFNKIFAKNNLEEINIEQGMRIDFLKVKESSRIVYGHYSRDNIDITSI